MEIIKGPFQEQIDIWKKFTVYKKVNHNLVMNFYVKYLNIISNSIMKYETN